MIMPQKNNDVQIKETLKFLALLGDFGPMDMDNDAIAITPHHLAKPVAIFLVYGVVHEKKRLPNDSKEVIYARCECSKNGCKAIGKHPHNRWREEIFNDENPRPHDLGYILKQLKNPYIEKTHARPKSWNLGFCPGLAAWISQQNPGSLPEDESNGYVVIDIDFKGEKEALAEEFKQDLCEKFPDIFKCLTVKTGNSRSMHLYMRAPKPVDKIKGWLGKTMHCLPGAEIKSGATYLAVPGSMHKSGERYEITVEAPPVPADIAQEVLDYLAEKYEIKAADSKPTATSMPAEFAHGDFSAPTISDDYDFTPRQIYAYLDTMEPSIEGSNGSGACFRAAVTLVKGFGLSISEAIPFMEYFNQTKCFPPWSDKEILHKLEDAEKKGTGKRLESRKQEKETSFPYKIKRNFKSARATAATTTAAATANPILMEEPVLPRAIPLEAPAGANAHSKPHTMPPATSRMVPPTKSLVQSQGLSDEELDSIGEAIAQARQEKNVGFVSSSSSSPTSLDSYRDRFCPRYRSFMLWDGKTRTNIVFDKPCEKLKCSYCRPRVQAHWMSTIKHHLEALPPDTPIYQFLFRSPDENRNSNPAWDTITTYIRKKKGQYLGVRGTMANTFHVFTTVDPIQDEAEDVDVITAAEAITRLKKLIDDMPTNWCTIGGFHEDLKGYLSSTGWKLLEDPKSDTDKKTFVGELRGPRSEHVKIIEGFGLDFHEGRPKGGYQIKRTSAIVYPKNIDAALVMQELLDLRYHPRIPDDPAFQWQRDIDKALKAIRAGEMTVEDVNREFGGFVPGSKEFAYFYSGLGQCGFSFTLNIEGLAREKTVCESPGTT